MQIAWIESFDAVAKQGSFGQAATRLFRSQSRVSSHIAALEHELGAELFDRAQRPIVLTMAGKAFYDYARAVLDNMEAGRGAVTAVRNLIAGEVTVATHLSAGASFMPQLIGDIGSANPEITIRLVSTAIFGLDDALRSGRVAIAIRPELPHLALANLRSRVLWSEPMKVVLARDHPLAKSTGTIDVTALASERLVITGEHLRQDTEASLMLQGLGVRVDAPWVTDQPEVLIGLVAAGLGVGFTNALALNLVRLDDVEVRDISPALQRRVCVYWMEDGASLTAARSVITAILNGKVPDGAHRELRSQASNDS